MVVINYDKCLTKFVREQGIRMMNHYLKKELRTEGLLLKEN